MIARRHFGTFLASELSLLSRKMVDPANSTSPPQQRLGNDGFYQLMETVARGWNDNDARLAAHCFSEDALYSAPPDPQIRRGRKALFEFFGGASGRPRPMHMTWHHLAFDPAHQIGFGEYTFIYQEQTHGIVIVQIRAGRIARWREYEHASPLSWEQMVGDNHF